MTLTVKIVTLNLLQTQNDYHKLMKLSVVKLSNMKYAANLPVTINNNNTMSLFNTGATISCMLKACFDKLQPKPVLIQTHAYKVNGDQ